MAEMTAMTVLFLRGNIDSRCLSYAMISKLTARNSDNGNGTNLYDFHQMHINEEHLTRFSLLLV